MNNTSNPYQTPRSNVECEEQSDKMDYIRGLDLPNSWIEKFLEIERAGGLNFDPSKVDKSKRISTNINFLAFFFGPIYLLIKGLWKQAIVYILLAFILGFIGAMFDISDSIARGIGMGLSMAFAMRANFSYYKKKVHGITPWF